MSGVLRAGLGARAGPGARARRPRGRHAAALVRAVWREGAINSLDDPESWEIGDAAGTRDGRQARPVLERLWAEPDESVHLARCCTRTAGATLEQRVAAMLPTLKVILLGGMQEPGHAAGSTLSALLQSGPARRRRCAMTGRVRGAVEEGLRWLTRRRDADPPGARVDVDLGGIAPGDAGPPGGGARPSANRDEADWGRGGRVRHPPPPAKPRRVRPRPAPLRRRTAARACRCGCALRAAARAAARSAARPGTAARLSWLEFRAPQHLHVTWARERREGRRRGRRERRRGLRVRGPAGSAMAPAAADGPGLPVDRPPLTKAALADGGRGCSPTRRS